MLLSLLQRFCCCCCCCWRVASRAAASRSSSATPPTFLASSGLSGGPPPSAARAASAAACRSFFSLPSAGDQGPDRPAAGAGAVPAGAALPRIPPPPAAAAAAARGDCPFCPSRAFPPPAAAAACCSVTRCLLGEGLSVASGGGGVPKAAQLKSVLFGARFRPSKAARCTCREVTGRMLDPWVGFRTPGLAPACHVFSPRGCKKQPTHPLAQAPPPGPSSPTPTFLSSLQSLCWPRSGCSTARRCGRSQRKQ